VLALSGRSDLEIGGRAPSTRPHRVSGGPKRDAEPLLVACLTVLATVIAFYDLLLLALHAR
jgi:hypothetical protein